MKSRKMISQLDVNHDLWYNVFQTKLCSQSIEKRREKQHAVYNSWK